MFTVPAATSSAHISVALNTIIGIFISLHKLFVKLIIITETYKRPSPPTTKTLPFPSAVAR